MKYNTTLTDELIFLLEKGNAHASFEDAVKDMPLHLVTEIPEALPYNIWQLVEHIRIAQWDIVEFCLSEKHVSPKWPDAYWPAKTDKPTEQDWKHSLEAIRKERKRFIKVLQEQSHQLLEAIPHGDGQTLLREALLIADHNAYHCGEIIVIRRLLHCWK